MNNHRKARGWSSRGAGKAAGFALLLACAAPQAILAADWPGWRGPNGDGTTASAQNLPETWGLGQNIKWQREMPAWSGSSPVVWGEKIFINSPSKEEVQAPAASVPPRSSPTAKFT